MSKTELKKYLKTLTQAQVSEILLDVYSARKEAKEYLDFFLNPDSEAKAEVFKKKIHREFVSASGYLKRHPRRSLCKKAVADFKSFQPDPRALVDVMLYYVELAERSRRLVPSAVPEAFLEAVAVMYVDAIRVALAGGFYTDMQKRFESILQSTRRWPAWISDHIESRRHELLYNEEME